MNNHFNSLMNNPIGRLVMGKPMPGDHLLMSEEESAMRDILIDSGITTEESTVEDASAIDRYIASGRQTITVSSSMAEIFSTMEVDASYIEEVKLPFDCFYASTAHIPAWAYRAEIAGRLELVQLDGAYVFMDKGDLCLLFIGIPSEEQRDRLTEVSHQRSMEQGSWASIPGVDQRFLEKMMRVSRILVNVSFMNVLVRLPLHVPILDSVALSIENATGKGLQDRLSQREREASHESVQGWSRFVINMLRYLDSRQPDFLEAPPVEEVDPEEFKRLARKRDLKPNEVKKLEKLQRKLYTTRIHRVGSRLERMMEEQREAIARRASPFAHIVFGHFQRYWYGPRNYNTRIWKWKNPFIKGVEDQDLAQELENIRISYKIN